jgi:hypothetical protein
VKLMRTDQENSKFEGGNRVAAGGGVTRDEKINVAAVVFLKTKRARARTMRHECGEQKKHARD